MHHCTHVLWDWNGTLINDTWLCHQVTNLELSKRNRPEISIDQYRKWMEIPIERFYRRLGLEVENGALEALSRSWHEVYLDRREECSLHEHTEKVLLDIAALGIEQSILSSHPLTMLSEVVSQRKLSGYFSELLAPSNLEVGSKVDLARQWIKRKNISAQKLTVVGDTLHDVEVAEALQARCILVTHGLHHPELLYSSPAPKCASLSEVFDTIVSPVQ